MAMAAHLARRISSAPAMAAHLARRISCAPALSRSSCFSARSALDELMKTESSADRLNRLLLISCAFDGLQDKTQVLERSTQVLERTLESNKQMFEKTVESNKQMFEKTVEDKALMLERSSYMLERTIEEQGKAVVALQGQVEQLKEAMIQKELELLRVRGLNNTRGLFERLQEKILERFSQLQGLKGSEATWQRVLLLDKVLNCCLQDHLGRGCNIAAHLAAMYQILSQHVHAGKELTLTKGTILFETHFLSPEQVQSMVCLGISAGIDVAPNRTSDPQ